MTERTTVIAPPPDIAATALSPRVDAAMLDRLAARLTLGPGERERINIVCARDRRAHRRGAARDGGGPRARGAARPVRATELGHPLRPRAGGGAAPVPRPRARPARGGDGPPPARRREGAARRTRGGPRDGERGEVLRTGLALAPPPAPAPRGAPDPHRRARVPPAARGGRRHRSVELPAHPRHHRRASGARGRLRRRREARLPHAVQRALGGEASSRRRACHRVCWPSSPAAASSSARP